MLPSTPIRDKRFTYWTPFKPAPATYTDLVLHVGCQLWKKSTKQRFFVVRELDTKILRAPTSSSTTSSNTLVVTSASSQKDAKGSSEQAIRAGIRTQILKQNLDARNANKEELDSLKRLNVVGKRAPTCMLLTASDTLKLLRISYGRTSLAKVLKEALEKLPWPDAASIKKYQKDEADYLKNHKKRKRTQRARSSSSFVPKSSRKSKSDKSHKRRGSFQGLTTTWNANTCNGNEGEDVDDEFELTSESCSSLDFGYSSGEQEYIPRERRKTTRSRRQPQTEVRSPRAPSRNHEDLSLHSSAAKTGRKLFADSIKPNLKRKRKLPSRHGQLFSRSSSPPSLRLPPPLTRVSRAFWAEMTSSSGSGGDQSPACKKAFSGFLRSPKIFINPSSRGTRKRIDGTPLNPLRSAAKNKSSPPMFRQAPTSSSLSHQHPQNFPSCSSGQVWGATCTNACKRVPLFPLHPPHPPRLSQPPRPPHDSLIWRKPPRQSNDFKVSSLPNPSSFAFLGGDRYRTPNPGSPPSAPGLFSRPVDQLLRSPFRSQQLHLFPEHDDAKEEQRPMRVEMADIGDSESVKLFNQESEETLLGLTNLQIQPYPSSPPPLPLYKTSPPPPIYFLRRHYMY